MPTTTRVKIHRRRVPGPPEPLFLAIMLITSVAVTLHLQAVSADIDTDTGTTTRNATIVIAGLAGVGKSDVVGQLLNRKLGLSKDDDGFEPKLSNLQEYQLNFKLDSDEQNEHHLKIVDVPGFVVDRSPEEDAGTLATLSSYLHTELQGHKPSIVLIVSTYDDNRAAGESSQFVQMLKRVQFLKHELVIQDGQLNQTNCIFLFIQAGRVRGASRKGVERKLNTFKGIIRNYTEFRDPIVATIGENDGEGYGLQRNADGFTKLSNGELYPKNLLEKMMELTYGLKDAYGHAAVRTLAQNYGARARVMNPDEPTLREIGFENESASEEFQTKKARYLREITGEILGLGSQSESEVATALQQVWDTKIDKESKQLYPTALVVLQKTLQAMNVSERAQLPAQTPEIVALFQRLPTQGQRRRGRDASEIYSELLEKAFSIRQPQLFISLVAGHGYDLVTDFVLDSSPWNLDSDSGSLVPTRIGYRLPPQYTVTKENKTQDVFYYVQDVEEYLAIRMTDLTTVPPEPALNLVDFNGQVRPAYNLKPAPAEKQHFTVSAIKEFHTFNLHVDEEAESLSMHPDFVAWLERLRPFDPTNRESEKEWRRFFGEWGTHVVMSAFGGGYMQATTDLGSRTVDIERSSFRHTLRQSLLEFERSPNNLSTVIHNFFGGEPSAPMQQIHKLTGSEQQALMSAWLASIPLSPVMLQTSLTLKPISQVAETVNSTIGSMIEEAAQLLYSGKLKFQPARKSSADKPKVPTRTTWTSTSTTPPTTALTTSASTFRPQSPAPRGVLTEFSARVRSAPTFTPNLAHQNDWRSLGSTTAAITVCSTEPPQPQQPDLIDDSEFHVGFGYSMFYDSGVPTSPFDLGHLQSPHPYPFYFHENVNITKYSSELYNFSCVIVPSRSEYIKRRVSDIEPTNWVFKTWSRYAAGSPVKESNFQHGAAGAAQLKPGYSIIADPYKINRVSSVGEHRLYKVFVDDWKRMSLSTSFRSSLDALPDYREGNCTVKSAWDDFIRKYGTHVLVSRNVGYENEIVKQIRLPTNFASRASTSTFAHSAMCAALESSTRSALKAENSLYHTPTPTSRNRDLMGLVYLSLDMKFEELSYIVKPYDYMKGSDLDSAIRNIWDFGFGCRSR